MANEFFDRVLKDVKEYNDRREIVKAGLFERLLTKKLDPDLMHPNPADEFTHEDVGPHPGIIESYCAKIRFNQLHDFPIFEEPIVVQKMKEGGYLILNGHHRWAAAIKMGVKKVRAVVVNM